MALNNEDKKDVQKHMGKALANKVSKVTKDKGNPYWSNPQSLKWDRTGSGDGFADRLAARSKAIKEAKYNK